MTTKNITFEFVPENFDEFRRKLKDLTRLSDNIKLSITDDKIFIYSILGSSQIVLAMKSYQLDRIDFIESNNSIEHTIDCIILGAKKFVKNIDFVKTNEKIKCKVTYKIFDDDRTEVRQFQLTSGKLKLKVETGDRNEIKNITKEQMNETLDPSKKEWSFDVNESDFTDISKLSKINTDESKRILNINAENNTVKLSEDGLWEMEVADTDQPDSHIMINKNHLPMIDTSGTDITFNVFRNFIFVEGENSKLMISFEQTFN